jgi:hypothetical protein
MSSGGLWLLHATFWVVLIFAYPRRPEVQAIFFWNPWVRRLAGMGYVGFALAWVPFLRSRLFAPFRESLAADARLKEFRDEDYYYSASEVRSGAGGKIAPLVEAIPRVRGQTILEGESGLGKTMFLRYLVGRSRRVVVFLPAAKCENDVAPAIQAKLEGPAKDPKFLRKLLYAGAIDIVIDGLNEVSAETRAKITAFLEVHFRGNIIVGTQPMEWSPPGTCDIYQLQPLRDEQIEAFLIGREAALDQDATVRGEPYCKACADYLRGALAKDKLPKPTIEAHRRVLSNPMDLTVVAQMLGRGLLPNLYKLEEQYYQTMAADFEMRNHREFPLTPFSTRVYDAGQRRAGVS